MTQLDEIHIREIGRVGRITLTRPEALNALTHNMALAIEAALDRWQTGSLVDLILVDSAGEKAFCAGGDVAALYKIGRAGDLGAARQFWIDEYSTIAKIANCTIPYVALMDGFVMGGGVGISGHASHGVATDRSMIAMPECGIGLIPDVGGIRLLAQAPGFMGLFLGMTGWRMTGADAVMTHFAKMLIKAEDIPEVTRLIEEQADPSVLQSFVVEDVDAPLDQHREAIDRHFAHDTALECVKSLEADPSEFTQKAAAMIRRASPLSVACTFEMVRRAKSFSNIEESLALEFRYVCRSMTEGDFLEGVRAQLIDKDRNPQWRVKRLEDVTEQMVTPLLASLGNDELELKGRIGA